MSKANNKSAKYRAATRSAHMALFNRYQLRLGLDKLGRKRLLRMLEEPNVHGSLRKNITKELRKSIKPPGFSVEKAYKSDIVELKQQYQSYLLDGIFKTPEQRHKARQAINLLSWVDKSPGALASAKVLKDKRGRVKGFMQGAEGGAGDFYVDNLVSSPHAILSGQKGIGSELLRVAQSEARGRDITLSPIKGSEGFYIKNGFRPDPTSKDFYIKKQQRSYATSRRRTPSYLTMV
jgi:hypothetical protein